MTSDLAKIEHLKGFLWLQKEDVYQRRVSGFDTSRHTGAFPSHYIFNLIAKFIFRPRNLETGKYRNDDEPHLHKQKKKNKKEINIRFIRLSVLTVALPTYSPGHTLCNVEFKIHPPSHREIFIYLRPNPKARTQSSSFKLPSSLR